MGLGEEIKEFANYQYQLTKEDEAEIVARHESELLKIMRIFPEFTYLESLAMLFSFTKEDVPLIVLKIIEKNNHKIIAFYETGETKIEPFSEATYKYLIKKYSNDLTRDIERILSKLKTLRDRILDLERKEGIIYPKQRFKTMIRNRKIRQIKNEVWGDPNIENIEDHLERGRKVLETIKMPSYIEEYGLEKNDNFRLGKIKFSEIKNIIAEIRKMANEMGIQDEAEFAITSIISYYEELFSKYSKKEGINLTIFDGEVSSLTNAFNEIHDYYYLLIEKYNLFLQNKPINEAKEIIEEIDTIPEAIENLITTVRTLAKAVYKSEESEKIIANYLREKNYQNMTLLIDHYSDLKIQFDKLKNTNFMIEGFNSILNEAQSINQTK